MIKCVCVAKMLPHKLFAFQCGWWKTSERRWPHIYI